MLAECLPPDLLVIVGMPGSGKTTYADKLIKRGQLDGFCDDYQHGPCRESNPGIYEEDKILMNALSEGKRWAIADTRYCDAIERNKLSEALQNLFPGLILQFVYFENNTELCDHNATVRKHGIPPIHERSLMYYYSDIYDIPEDAKVIKIKRA